ncbi:conserved unknown protein [Ectocarpus siliculosus]|uniref:HECT-type E3 ubiquitin transferase n=1 Tax=Ectocarpus siliculosus TaxID=2880 RepID=D7FKM0_ECTSI|nr:conserved unknown protein [Ectocarpus siliculosus]|eukprot:CBJ29420.1 conserved unknown protein [Ectocarpus siliculosus]
MWTGESKKRPTVSLRGRSKEEDRGEFLRRARAQREGRARERLHVSSATTIQKVWRGRSCVGKWRQDERDAWDRKMHDVGRVKAMLAAAGKALQLPPAVLQSLLSQLVHFHAFPSDAGRFRAAMDLVLAAAPASDNATTPGGAGLFAAQPASSSGSDNDRLLGDNTWSLLVTRLGAVCLQYMSQVSATAAAAGGRSRKNGAESRDIGGGGGGCEGDAMDDAEGAEGAVVAGAESAEVVDAAEVAMRGFALLASPAAWRHRWSLSEPVAVKRRCRVFLASLALGRVLMRTRSKTGEEAGPGEALRKPSPTGRGRGRGREGLRLSLRTERERVGGEGSRAPTLFGVLRVAWDAAVAEAGGGEGRATQAVRLLCASSFQILGIGVAEDGESTARIETRPMSSSAVAGGGARAAAGPGGAHETAVPDRRRLLEAFAAAVLPAPRLLEHPLRAALMDPMLGGDGVAWWELVSVAGEAVGAGGTGGGGGAAARRRDVAWAVANILEVDTGSSAERAPCLVRALCRLLRKVSLHALLQGAGRTGAAGAGGAGRQMESPELTDDDEDDDDVAMDEAFSGAASERGGARAAPSGGGGAGAKDDFGGGRDVRLEAIVRRHRRRCAMRTESLAAHQQSLRETKGSSRGGYSSGSKRCVSGGGGDERESAAAMVFEEIEAMAAAAGRLADPVVVGRLFDSILPPVARSSSEGQQTGLGGGSRAEASSKAQADPRGGSAGAESRSALAGDAKGDDNDDDDPVLALCSLYADLVMDGVRAAGSAAAAAGGSSTAAGGSSAAAGKSAVAPGKSVLNALAFGRPKAPIAARLWGYLQRGQDLAVYAKRGAGGGGGGSDRGGAGNKAGGGGMQSALFLFCSACSHQLLALDDEEFYEKQRPLKLEEVRQLAGFLKEWLCRMYLIDPVIPRLREDGLPSDPTLALRQCEDHLREALLLLSATRLFNQLYDRNTRREFLKAESWYWKAISAVDLSPPDQGDPRVAFLSKGNLGMVLANIPQVVPFFQRVGIFRQMIDAEREEHQGSLAFARGSSRIRVSRDSLYEDSAEALTKLGSFLKGRIQVTFMNQHGVEEAGIDGGGVFKEYMDLLTKRAFDPQYALFVATQDQYLFPNPAASMVADDYLFHFEFLGRVLAKAVFEDILVEPQFSPVFLNKLLGRYNYIDDLYSLDPEVYRNLMQLKGIVHSGGDVADLCLTFSASTTAFGETKVWDLIPGGRDVAVTNASVISYIHLMAHFKLNVQTARPCKAFMKGFRDLIPVEWVRMFNPQELQRLIGGEGGRAIDVEDLKRNTLYAGGYHKTQPVMQWFWEAIESFSPEEQGQFLKFVTSCSRPPLLGFERLNPPICLQRVPEGDEGRLPSSATCMNLLKLPQYEDRQTLREKLLYAISANAGFELT